MVRVRTVRRPFKEKQGQTLVVVNTSSGPTFCLIGAVGLDRDAMRVLGTRRSIT